MIDGGFKRAHNLPGDWQSIGDAWNQYLAYLETQADGQSVISEFMNLTSTQQNVICNDFQYFTNKGSTQSWVGGEALAYAYLDQRYTGPDGAAAVITTAVGIMSSQMPNWKQYGPAFNSLNPTDQMTVATLCLQQWQDKTITNPMGAVQGTIQQLLIAEAAAKEQKKVDQDLEVAGVILGSVLVAGLVAYYAF
jgi:hypothetical protein